MPNKGLGSFIRPSIGFLEFSAPIFQILKIDARAGNSA